MFGLAVLILFTSISGIVSLECYSCTDVLDLTKCNSTVMCTGDEVCFHNKTPGAQGKSDLKCTNKQNCGNQNPVSIVGRHIHARQTQNCQECCADDLCNKNLCSKQNRTCQDDIRFDCARLDSLYNICKDKNRAQTVCPNFCGLCKQDLTDCYDVLNVGGKNTDGIYAIKTWQTHSNVDVFCDMTTDGGGWTVFQYRFNGSVDFYRNFTEYENGFGDLNSEFWLGLRYIQEIAAQGSTDLRIMLEAPNGTKGFEQFDNFHLDPSPDYTLRLGQTTDSLRISSSHSFGPYHNGSKFTTYDHDADLVPSGNCAENYHGAWWYNSCHVANLNGQYLVPGREYSTAMNYESFLYFPSLLSSKMMIRRSNV